MKLKDTLPSDLATVPQETTRRVLKRRRRNTKDVEVREYLEALRLRRIQDLVRAAADLAERYNYEVLPVFHQQWQGLKAVLVEPAKVTVRTLCDLPAAVSAKVEEFCRWFHSWTKEQSLARGQA